MFVRKTADAVLESFVLQRKLLLLGIAGILRDLGGLGRNPCAFTVEKRSVIHLFNAFTLHFSSDSHPLPPVDLGLKTNWSQCCPI